MLICIDGFADDVSSTRKSKLLHQPYVRKRHYMISTITPTHIYEQISPLLKKNLTHLFIYRLRNYGDLEYIIEEMSAIYVKKTLLQMYHEAVSEPYPFLYTNLMVKDKRKMFMERFDKHLIPS